MTRPRAFLWAFAAAAASSCGADNDIPCAASVDIYCASDVDCVRVWPNSPDGMARFCQPDLAVTAAACRGYSFVRQSNSMSGTETTFYYDTKTGGLAGVLSKETFTANGWCAADPGYLSPRTGPVATAATCIDVPIDCS